MSQVNETRANPLQQNTVAGGLVGKTATGAEVVMPLPVSPSPVICCFQCKHWDRRWPTANHAECMQAKKYASGGASLMTTDLQTCSQAELKVR